MLSYMSHKQNKSSARKTNTRTSQGIQNREAGGKNERLFRFVSCILYLMGVELTDRRLSSHNFELLLPLREGRLRLLRCKTPRQLETRSRPPQGVLPVVVVL